MLTAKPFLTRTLTALALAALCSGAHAQDASFASASDSGVFSAAPSDPSTDTLSNTPSSSLSSADGASAVTDIGIGLVGLSLFSLLHGGSSSGGSAAPVLMPNASPAAVPEASSVVSFGLLLTLGLGGLFVTTRTRRTT